jgi:hypothetical protein
MKKYLLIGGGIAMIGIALFMLLLLLITPEKKNYIALSERSLAYIKTQKSKENTFWMPVDFNDQTGDSKNVLGSSRVRITKCFAFDISFSIRDGKQLGPCVFKYYFDDPTGYMILSLVSREEKDIGEISGVAFRRFEKNSYTESTLKTDKYAFLLFKKQGDTYENAAFRLFRGRLFTMSFIASTNADLDNKFRAVLNSLEFLY